MKRFAFVVLLSTLVFILVSVREAEGQLGFRFPRTRTGRSLKNVSIYRGLKNVFGKFESAVFSNEALEKSENKLLVKSCLYQLCYPEEKLLGQLFLFSIFVKHGACVYVENQRYKWTRLIRWLRLMKFLRELVFSLLLLLLLF